MVRNMMQLEGSFGALIAPIRSTSQRGIGRHRGVDSANQIAELATSGKDAAATKKLFTHAVSASIAFYTSFSGI